MSWIKIERDASGLASEECLNKLIDLHNQGFPIVVIERSKDGYKYNIIFAEDFIDDWVAEIERDPDFTEFIEIPPFD